MQEYAFKGPPYPRSRGFDRAPEAGSEHQQLITDLFETITLYDLRVEKGSASRRPDGKWEVTIDIEARKLYADGKGVETEAPLDEVFDVGVFTAEPGKKGYTSESVVSMARHRVRSGRETLLAVVNQEPKFVGFDPYNKYVDRNSDDNVQKLEGAEEEAMIPAAAQERPSRDRPLTRFDFSRLRASCYRRHWTLSHGGVRTA